MEKIFVAKQVAKKLQSTEAAVDVAMIEAAEFLGEMLKARKDVNASLIFADDAQVKMMAAMKALSEARTAMVGVQPSSLPCASPVLSAIFQLCSGQATLCP